MSLKEGDGDVLKKFIDRLRLRFDAVSRAWHRVKRSVPQSGTLSADKLYRIIDESFCIGMREHEIHHLIRSLDKNRNDAIPFREFEAVVSSALLPQVVSADVNTGLSIAKSIAQEQKHFGKCNHFRYDHPVSFNNKYRQTLDESGKPLLKNLFSGAYTFTDKLNIEGGPSLSLPEQRPEGKRIIVPENFQMAKDLNVPMIRAVLEGSWYGQKSGEGKIGHTLSTHDRNYNRDHCRTMNAYSQIVKSIKPPLRKIPLSMSTSAQSPGQASSRLTRRRCPTSVKEVSDVYGRLVVSRAATSMANYLSAASPEERARYVRAISKAGSDTDSLLQAMDKHPGNKSPWRPASSLGNSTSWTIQDSPMNASENCDKEKDETCQRPVSHASSRHLRPTSAASCLMPKGISHSAALSEATTFRNAVKIASTTHSAGSGQKTSDDLASTRTTVGTKRSAVSPEGRWAPSLHSTSNSNYLDASRNSIRRLEHPDKVGNRMHLDLQKTAFGASFSAKRMDHLQKELWENATAATGISL